MLLGQEAASDNSTWLVWGILLTLGAILLVVLELGVPSGGLIGLVAGVAAIGSIVAFFMYDTMIGFAALLGYIILVPIAGIFGFKVWLNSPLARRMILGSSTEGFPAEDEEGGPEAHAPGSTREREALRSLIGVEGTTATALRPIGTVVIEGRRIDAFAETGVIEAGIPVIVTEVYDNQIKVRPRT